MTDKVNRVVIATASAVYAILTWAGIISVYVVVAPEEFKALVNAKSYSIYLTATISAIVYWLVSMKTIAKYLLNVFVASAAHNGMVDRESGRPNNSTDKSDGKSSLKYTLERYVGVVVFLVMASVTLALLKSDFENERRLKDIEHRLQRLEISANQ